MQLNKFIILLFAILLVPLCAEARKGGIKITSENQNLIIEISDSLACMFRPKKVFPIPGTIKVTGNNSYFLPRKQSINQKLKALRKRGKSESFIRYRKQKLVKALKKLRETCNEYKIIRESAESALLNALSPDGSLDSFLDLATELFSGSSDLRSEYVRDLSILLSVFNDKDDFINLSKVMEKADSIREIDNSSSAAIIGEVSDQAVECNEETTHLYFVPGVNVDIFTSFLQAAYLREYFNQTNPSSTEDIAFRVWFNKSNLPGSSGGEICQLFLGLAASETPSDDNSENINKLPTELQNLAQAYDKAFENCINEFEINSSDVQSLSEWQTDAENYSPEASEITALKNQITLDIQSGRKVILVGHSQGNKLIESVLAGLGSDGDGELDDSVGVTAIAPTFNFSSPENYGDFSAFTMSGDLTTDVNNSPSSNISNSLSTDSNISPETHRFLQNDFVISYLGDSTNAESIFEAISSQAENIENPREFLGQGFFQVSLSWDIDGDIDLHMFEPNGTHVFWSNKTGIVGQLDRDDIPGDGPENYFVCNRSSMETGTYRVQVNNYGGTIGTKATITVRGKFSTETYLVTMDAPNAGSTLLDVVDVEYGSDGSFTFTDTRD
ncbi:MAG: hypothetical protein KDD56_00655 [Bdellovibrionales bacterium]|nr:hypothetical protein [Bdellovibrionales bacterium]